MGGVILSVVRYTLSQGVLVITVYQWVGHGNANLYYEDNTTF